MKAVDITPHGQATPDKAAVVMGSGLVRSYGELLGRSDRVANLLHSWGLRRGDGVLFMLPNGPEVFEVAWAAQRSGLYYTPINTHFTADEVAYLVEDSGAKALFVDASFAAVAEALDHEVGRLEVKVVVGGSTPGYLDYEEEVERAPAGPPPEPSSGTEMMYSSGTTGRPKAVRRPLPGPEGSWSQSVVEEGLRTMYAMTPSDVYLSPAPLYHSAPLAYTMATMRLGATVVVMEHFDAEHLLRLIERHRVSHVQLVPTMFVRLMKLAPEVRSAYDLSSLRAALHSAAPCPVDVKRAMMEWWGPIIYEYYAGTEGFAATFIGPEEWLAHPGSVGKPANRVHIMGDDGELGPGKPGVVYFEDGPSFEYLNDPAKTASVSNEQGWRTLGDVGYLDDDGYLYLTDRATFMIVSGGVNIYPQEIENVLVLHEKVADAAVFGVPNPEFGEEVKAVVQPTSWDEAGDELAAELTEYCRSRLAGYKCPRSIDFEKDLPRDPNGKLYKNRLRDPYWQGHHTRLL
jgi:long-chain acyl-CoA synthetase